MTASYRGDSTFVARALSEISSPLRKQSRILSGSLIQSADNDVLVRRVLGLASLCSGRGVLAPVLGGVAPASPGCSASLLVCQSMLASLSFL